MCMLTSLVDETHAFIYYCEDGLMHLLVNIVEVRQHFKIWAFHFLQNFSLVVTELNYLGMCNGLLWLGLCFWTQHSVLLDFSLLCSCILYLFAKLHREPQGINELFIIFFLLHVRLPSCYSLTSTNSFLH